MAIRPPDPNETAPRYTTLEIVKSRLGIEATDTSRDAELTSAIVAGEWALDVELGRGFPDLTDPDDPAVILVVPEAIKVAALSLAIASWKEADAPAGTAGSDSFFGAVSVSDAARDIVRRSPMLRGFKVKSSFGVAGIRGLSNG